MAVATFDTLKFANTLKVAGVPELVTKEDLRQELRDSAQSVISRIDRLEARFRGDMLLLKWMFAAIMMIDLGILFLLFV